VLARISRIDQYNFIDLSTIFEFLFYFDKGIFCCYCFENVFLFSMSHYFPKTVEIDMAIHIR
jgi:hypothetical protein